MRRRLRALAALLPILALAACLRDADPISVDDDRVHVHAVLAAGADSAVVLLSKPGTVEQCGIQFCSPGGPVPVGGADVRLVRGADTTFLVERASGPCAAVGVFPVGSGEGCYDATLTRPVEPGVTYELDIRLADGGRVTGSTVVPAPPAIEAPAAGGRIDAWCNSEHTPPGSPPYCSSSYIDEPPYFVPVARFRVRWTPAAGAELGEVAVWGRTGYRADAVLPDTRCTLDPQPYFEPTTTRRDSVTWPVYGVSCQDGLATEPALVAWDSVAAEVMVTHHDPAYAEYIEAVHDRDAARIGKVQAGLDGALGVFGAVASARRMIMVIRNEGAAPGTQ